MRYPVAFHAACYEVAVGAVIEKVCDHYCRYPKECSSQEELDEHCDNCELIRTLHLIFEEKENDGVQ